MVSGKPMAYSKGADGASIEAASRGVMAAERVVTVIRFAHKLKPEAINNSIWCRKHLFIFFNEKLFLVFIHFFSLKVFEFLKHQLWSLPSSTKFPFSKLKKQ